MRLGAGRTASASPTSHIRPPSRAPSGKGPDLCGDVEQIADEILDMGNERQQQVCLRFPVIGTAIAAGIDQTIMQAGVHDLQESKEYRIQPLQAGATVQVGKH